MCGIAGFFHSQAEYLKSPKQWYTILEEMNRTQKHRGPNDDGIFLTNHCGLSHVRLAIIDLVTGNQPMSRKEDGRTCTIVFNGEIYNMLELKRELEKEGCQFYTTSDTEVILMSFMRHGINWFSRLNGVFAFAIWDESSQTLTLARDHAGVKPLYYSFYGDTFLFASEIKGILTYPGMEAIVDTQGLCEIFALGPAHTPGNGVFKNIKELLPAHYMILSQQGCQIQPYWKLKSTLHEESFAETVEHTRYLITDAVKMQMLSDVPICTFLSGGVDSSLVTSICSEELRKQGKQLATFSFDFQGNDQYFRANSFQVSRDRPYVDQMVFCCQTNHQYLECNNQQMADYLYRAVDARDLPCMADVESSMLYFCEQVSHFNRVTLTGECADEIFGGYPWFHRPELLHADGFPWSNDMTARSVLLSDEVLTQLPLSEYAHAAWETSKKQAPLLDGESAEESARRQITWLNMQWFMMTLLHRMDRTSMQNGLE
ncbi:MAG: asparagine synthase (glutamine-hydrolyzing), partial [Lachnospiraceae bacterium]